MSGRERFDAALAGPSGVHELPADASADELAGAAAARGFSFLRLDAAGLTAADALLERARVALALPDHFGGNWDALLDMLRDLSWSPVPGWVLACTSADALVRSDPAGFDRARRVFDEACSFWRDRMHDRTPLHVFVPRARSEP